MISLCKNLKQKGKKCRNSFSKIIYRITIPIALVQLKQSLCRSPIQLLEGNTFHRPKTHSSPTSLTILLKSILLWGQVLPTSDTSQPFSTKIKAFQCQTRRKYQLRLSLRSLPPWILWSNLNWGCPATLLKNQQKIWIFRWTSPKILLIGRRTKLISQSYQSHNGWSE